MDTDNVFGNDRVEFPFGASASSTRSHLVCAMCGREYNKPPEGADPDWWEGGPFVQRFDFGPLEIGPCCFRKVEKIVDRLLPDIIRWKKANADLHLQYAQQQERLAQEALATLGAQPEEPPSE